MHFKNNKSKGKRLKEKRNSKLPRQSKEFIAKEKNKIWNSGLYIRLSQEDEEKRKRKTRK